MWKWFNKITDNVWFLRIICTITVSIALISAIIQIVCINRVAHMCSETGHSMACVGSACRCVDEIRNR